jgi:hypothetical protein
LTTILSKFIHEEAISTLIGVRVVMATPVMPQLMGYHSHHLRQDHLFPAIVVGAKAGVIDDTLRRFSAEILKLCEHNKSPHTHIRTQHTSRADPTSLALQWTGNVCKAKQARREIPVCEKMGQAKSTPRSKAHES